MRRMITAALAALVVCAFVVIPTTAASAVEPPPGPVDPATLLPSQVQRAFGTGSPVGDEYLKVAAYLKQALNARAAGAVAAPAAEGVPITGVTTLSRGAGGSALTGAFMAGWMITDGTLALYGATTGVEPMAPACSVMPEWTHEPLRVFYPFSMPDCAAILPHPNVDIVLSTSMSAAGVTITYVRAATVAYCYLQTGTLAAPAVFEFFGGNPSPLQRGTTIGNTGANGCTGSERSVPFLNVGSASSIRIRSSSSGAILATLSTNSANPQRTPDCKLTWPGGGTTTASGAKYTEVGGLPLHSIESACQQAFVSKPGAGPGLLPTEIQIGSTNDESGARTELATSPVPDFTESERKGLTPGTTAGGLVLQKVAGATVSSCMTWSIDCSGWWEETDEGTSTTSPYRCLYNGSAVSLVECGIYRHTFDTQTQTPTITDPVTGEEVGWSAQPSTGNSINPGTGPGTAGSPADQCFATGWAAVANPIDWVLVPIKCALVWAFVPRVAVVEETVTGLGQAAGDVASVDPLIALMGTLPASNGCDGIPIDITFFGQVAHGQLLAACDGYARTAATVVNGLLTLVVCTAALVAVTKYAAAVFGFVGPGGRFDEQQYSNHMMASRARND